MCNQIEKSGNIQMKGIFKKEFRSKLEKVNDKIWQFIENNKLEMEKVIELYTNYVHKIIRNTSLNISDEDIEEITLDVFFTLWKNQYKLDLNKNMSSYIAGITRNLIKKKYRELKLNVNIEAYEEQITDLNNIEFTFYEKEKNQIILQEINKLKQEDKDIFFMYYYDNMKLKEVAEKLNISESKTKIKLHRIRKKLKKVLKDRGYVNNE